MTTTLSDNFIKNLFISALREKLMLIMILDIDLQERTDMLRNSICSYLEDFGAVVTKINISEKYEVNIEYNYKDDVIETLNFKI